MNWLNDCFDVIRTIACKQHQQSAVADRPAVIELDKETVRLFTSYIIVMNSDRLIGHEVVRRDINKLQGAERS